MALLAWDDNSRWRVCVCAADVARRVGAAEVRLQGAEQSPCAF